MMTGQMDGSARKYRRRSGKWYLRMFLTIVLPLLCWVGGIVFTIMGSDEWYVNYVLFGLGWAMTYPLRRKLRNDGSTISDSLDNAWWLLPTIAIFWILTIPYGTMFLSAIEDEDG